MRVSFNLPTQRQSRAFIDEQDTLLFTYTAIGATIETEAVGDYDNDISKARIGSGQMCFEQAKKRIKNWQMFPAGWTVIVPHNAPIREGETVAVYARFMGLWWRNACRVVYIIDEPGRYGFAYGTLPGHIEKGEELFMAELGDGESVWYTVKAFSRPNHWLARLFYPVMRRLQLKFRNDSTQAMMER